MTFTQGQPCWIDVAVPDGPSREGLMAFLSGMFGWSFEIGVPEMGFYTMASLGGGATCAIAQEQDGTGAWFTYVATDDVDASTGAVKEAGGQVIVAPVYIPGSGMMAMCADPVGAVFGLWQEAGFAGFGSFGRPGAPCWFDHVSPDPQTAQAFYARAFGLSPQDAGGPDSVTLGRDGTGFMSFSSAVEGQPAAWMPIIAVGSARDAEARAVELGASVMLSGQPVPGGIVSAFAAPRVGTVVLAYESPEMPA